jgi:hypothetical protein
MSEAFGPYPDPLARDRELDELCRRLGAEKSSYGESVDGRDLVAVFIKGRSEEGRAVSVCANIHGIEWIGNRIAHAFLAGLDGGASASLLDVADVWVFPCLNPDGYERTFAQEGKGRTRDMRKNGNKVDLNRNFPLPFGAEPSWWPTSGSYHEDDATYRGRHPLSEPETRHLVAKLDDVRPWASANLHSFMGTMIPPRTPASEDSRGYQELHQHFSGAQSHARYRLMQSPTFDVFTGEQEDHQHHVQRTWAACFETFPVLASIRQHLRAPSTFWRFNPHDPEPWVDNDLPAIVAFLHAALERDRPPAREGAATPRTTWRQDGP